MVKLVLAFSSAIAVSDPSMSHSERFFLPFEEIGKEDDLCDCIPDWGSDDFFVGRRNNEEFSRAMPLRQEGLRIVEFDSEAEIDEQIVAIGDSSFACDADLPFCWECLHVEDPVEEFDWEDVSDRIEVENSPNPFSVQDEGQYSDLHVDWEVLLLAMGRNDAESIFVDEQEGFAYASEYEVLFDQVGAHGEPEWIKTGRPAAKSVLETLPSVLLTADDVSNKNTICAVCKDEISLSERVKRLPCLHYYHDNCILPWLLIRNTCPLCRYELPSNDA